MMINRFWYLDTKDYYYRCVCCTLKTHVHSCVCVKLIDLRRGKFSLDVWANYYLILLCFGKSEEILNGGVLNVK